MSSTSKAFQIELKNSSDTARLGRELARLVEQQALVALVGPLGAGKTTFTKGVAEELGVEELVSSPTFTMLNEYGSGRIPLYHFDLYRLRNESSDAESAAEEGFQMLAFEIDELLAGKGLLVIEWADYFGQYMSEQDYILIELNYLQPDAKSLASDQEQPEIGRTARISAHGRHSSKLIDGLANVYFS